LLAPRDGEYTLELRTDGAARVLLDGQPRLLVCGAGEVGSQTATVALGAGPHRLAVDYAATAGAAVLELYWTPPGEARALVPPAALRYPPPGDGAPALPSPPPNPCGGP
jgi:hypothetical protein